MHPCARYLTVPSRTGRAPVVPPAHPMRLRHSREVNGLRRSLRKQRILRAWGGLVLASLGHRSRVTLSTVAPCRRALSILLCRPVLAVLLSCPQRTPVLLLHAAFTRGAREPALGRAEAHSSGLGAGARLISSALSPCTTCRRTVPSRPLCHAVPSRTGGAPVVPPAHANVALRGP